MKIHVTAESTCKLIIIGPCNDFDESENTVDSRDSGQDFAKVTYTVVSRDSAKVTEGKTNLKVFQLCVFEL